MAQDKKGRKKSATSKQTHAAIDRLEDNDMAVLLVGDDERTKLDVPVSLLPEGAKGGDHLRITITLDRTSSTVAKDRISQLQDQLAEKSGTQGKKDFKL